MAIINRTERTLAIKVVYYGPEGSGKETNLTQLHQLLAPEMGKKGPLVSLPTGKSRTLSFNFTPAEEFHPEWKTTFNIWTLTGRVLYDHTRQLVLRGVDAIVFVAESQESRWMENQDTWQNLKENLKVLQKELPRIPVVLQCNKCELTLPSKIPALERLLDPDGFLHQRGSGWVSLQAIANRGSGVIETFDQVKRLIIEKYVRKPEEVTV
ncbi:MAG: hypothetical protein A2664_00395 [Candidatus Taylorbacteria bacterium RIFCSPHIGHO2_01_FULL_46_22b]|uniref:Gliding-motility protein MglA n=1 Tax=Candidatus Taylorbacteria bacterium RIFCSPHIGHO2_01_FULL_46_22b TaxID=1802301 RepID=A0A1G2M4E4_9BACT|nr:MAG: hypothetical protein A2664_00395 [Candidatus Taylorbacteria bacterium RIFCSPHIGHO2_01_FULL_46_22b]